MKAGTVIRSFNAKDDRKVVLRAPKWEDLDDFLELINSLVEEGADIYMDKKTTREKETDWVAKLLSDVEKDSKVTIVAEVNGKMIGEVSLDPRKGRQRHVGSVGIIILNGYRDIGIGTELFKDVENQAKRFKLEILTLEVADSNSRARHLYEKAGYHAGGRTPKGIIKDGDRVDIINMVKEI